MSCIINDESQKTDAAILWDMMFLNTMAVSCLKLYACLVSSMH